MQSELCTFCITAESPTLLWALGIFATLSKHTSSENVQTAPGAPKPRGHAQGLSL